MKSRQPSSGHTFAVLTTCISCMLTLMSHCCKQESHSNISHTRYYIASALHATLSFLSVTKDNNRRSYPKVAPYPLATKLGQQKLACSVCNAPQTFSKCVPSSVQIVSAVLYLECCSCAGPTVVLGCGKPSRQGNQAWVAFPLQGAVLLYPGTLFHGVLPGKGLLSASQKGQICCLHKLSKQSLLGFLSQTPEFGKPPAWPFGGNRISLLSA